METTVYYSSLLSAGYNTYDISKSEMKKYLGISGQIYSMTHHTIGDPNDSAIVVNYSGSQNSDDDDYDYEHFWGS